jgi:hypothetical protein
MRYSLQPWQHRPTEIMHAISTLFGCYDEPVALQMTEFSQQRACNYDNMSAVEQGTKL